VSPPVESPGAIVGVEPAIEGSALQRTSEMPAGVRRWRVAAPQPVRVFLRSRKAAFGVALFTAILLVALLAPLLARTSPTDFVADPSLAPSLEHPFGTTLQGQDVFSQVAWGARRSLMIGSLAALFSTIAAASIGMLAAYRGGIVDEALTAFTNIFLVLPGLPLLLIISAYLPVKSALSMALIVAFTTWAGEARVLRSQALSLRRRDFVLAAAVAGESTWRIVFGEIMPNMVSRIAVGYIGAFVGAIHYETALEFIGFGDLEQASWGTSLFWAQTNQALLTGSWWHFVFPGMAVALTATALIFVNYGIDELSNPRLRALGRPQRWGWLRRMLVPGAPA